eukprot:evm.model.scf_248EXC.2 EVM.evm.TU.scf_248EXC.2   scf_248EXC:2354-3743(+)
MWSPAAPHRGPPLCPLGQTLLLDIAASKLGEKRGDCQRRCASAAAPLPGFRDLPREDPGARLSRPEASSARGGPDPPPPRPPSWALWADASEPVCISGRSSFKTMGGVVAGLIRRDGACRVQAFGHESEGALPLSRTLQVLSTAQLMLRDRGDVRLICWLATGAAIPDSRLSESVDAEGNGGHYEWVFHLLAVGGSAREHEERQAGIEYETFRVSRTTSPSHLRDAIMFAVASGRRVAVTCAGLRALGQAFRGLASASGAFGERGLALLIDPEVRPVDTNGTQPKMRGYRIKLGSEAARALELMQVARGGGRGLGAAEEEPPQWLERPRQNLESKSTSVSATRR